MSARWTEEEYQAWKYRKEMQQKPRNSQAREPSRSEAETVTVVAIPSKKKDRFAENAGELGQKIHAHQEQRNGHIRLWLPYPPSTNSRMTAFKGRMIKSAEARSYQKIVKTALVGLKPLTGDLEVSLTVNRPKRRGDLDNAMKNVFDALTGIAFLDDEQIAIIDARRHDGVGPRADPGIHIQINQIG